MIESKGRIGGKHLELEDEYSKASATTNIGKKRAVGGVMKSSGNKERKLGEERGRPGLHIGGLIPWEGMYRSKRSVWTVATRAYLGSHFAVFPPKLITPCILAGSAPGDTVLDPFCGSGTTLRTANYLGRDAIGIELNPAYECLIRDRMAQGFLDFDEEES